MRNNFSKIAFSWKEELLQAINSLRVTVKAFFMQGNTSSEE
jgi:hypothetical protein